MNLICVKCHDEDQVVTVSLTQDHMFHCEGCEEDYTADDVREYLDSMKAWEKVLAWVESSPFRCEKPDAA